jgi:hypothetical protein
MLVTNCTAARFSAPPNIFVTSHSPSTACALLLPHLVKLVYLTVWPALTSHNLPVLIDKTCRTNVQNPLDHPDFTRLDWAAFHVCVEDRLPGNLTVNEEEAIDKCVEELTSIIQEVLAESAPKRRSRAEPRPPLLANI